MSEEETFTTGELISGQPDLGSAPVVQDQALIADGILSGSPDIAQCPFTENNVLVANPITTGSPTIPTLIYDAALGRIIDIDQDSASRAELSVTGPNKVEIAA